MRSASSRDILFLDLVIRPQPHYAPTKTMEVIATYFEELYTSNKAQWWTKQKTKKIHIRELKVDASQGLITMLLYFGDKEATGASFTNLETDVQRDEPLLDGEGRPDSAHVLISMRPYKKGQFRYATLLEVSPSLSRNRVERYFNFLMAEVKKLKPDHFTAKKLDGSTDKDGKPTMEKYTNKIELQGHLSDDLQEDLQAGELRGIALETSDKMKFGFGEAAYVKPSRQTVTLKPVTNWRKEPMRAIKEAISIGNKKKYETARINFTTSDSMNHTTRIDTETQNLIADGYIKKRRIFLKQLPEASVKCEAKLVAEMKILMKEVSG